MDKNYLILFEADVERFCVATMETVPDRVRDVVIETVPNRAMPDPFQNRAMSDCVTFKYFVPCRLASSIMLSLPNQINVSGHHNAKIVS